MRNLILFNKCRWNFQSLFVHQSLFATSNIKQLTLYDKLGGTKTVELVVDYLYDQVLEDPSLKGFFRGADIPILKKNQMLFIQGLFGGPSLYTSNDLPSLHHGLGIQEKHFDIFKAHFVNVMRNLQIKEKIVNEAVEILEREKKNIIKTSKPLAGFGGDSGLQGLLEQFYKRLIADGILVSRVPGEIPSSEKESFIELHKKFIKSGLSNETDRDVSTALHSFFQNYYVTDQHFYRMKVCLGAIMRESKVSEEAIDQMMALFEIERVNITKETSPFTDLGGEKGMKNLINTFFHKVLRNPILSPYFANVDLDRIKRHKTLFLVKIFGGPNKYAGKDLKAAHFNLNLSELHFSTMRQLLEKSLKEQHLTDEKVKLCLNSFDRHKGDIIATQLFDKLGGMKNIQRILNNLYDRVLSNENLFEKYFKDRDIPNLKRHQKYFLSFIFGGPRNYKGRDIDLMHRDLNVSSEDFDLFMKIFRETLKELRFSLEVIEETVKLLEARKQAIVKKN